MLQIAELTSEVSQQKRDKDYLQQQVKGLQAQIQQLEALQAEGASREELEAKMHDMRLSMSELRLTNQELTEKVRELQIRNEQLQTEGALERVTDMDGQITELIKSTSAYKGDYLKALEQSQRFQAELKARESTVANLQSGHDGLQTILRTTQGMLDLTKEQYSTQLDTNTQMRTCLTELYNMVVAPDATKLDNNGRVTAMTPETQMQIVQAINRVLNPAHTVNQSS